MSTKKIIAYVIFIIVLLFLPEIIYITMNNSKFSGSLYNMYYGAKILFVGIALFMFFAEYIKHID